MDYDKEFAKIRSYSTAGLAHDIKRHIVDGYGFWHAGDVVRHLGGENNMYKSYYINIENAANDQGPAAAVKVAAEAAEYARQKKNLLQFWGFILEETLYSGEIDKFIDVSFSVCDYCFEQGKANPPFWVYVHGITICQAAYETYRKAFSVRDAKKARMCIYILYHLVFFLMDAYKARKEYKLYDESMYYYLIMVKYAQILMTNKTEAEKNRITEQMIKDALIMIQNESPNWQTIFARANSDKAPRFIN